MRLRSFSSGYSRQHGEGQQLSHALHVSQPHAGAGQQAGSQLGAGQHCSQQVGAGQHAGPGEQAGSQQDGSEQHVDWQQLFLLSPRNLARKPLGLSAQAAVAEAAATVRMRARSAIFIVRAFRKYVASARGLIGKAGTTHRTGASRKHRTFGLNGTIDLLDVGDQVSPILQHSAGNAFYPFKQQCQRTDTPKPSLMNTGFTSFRKSLSRCLLTISAASLHF